jgi:hypothetical protein
MSCQRFPSRLQVPQQPLQLSTPGKQDALQLHQLDTPDLADWTPGLRLLVGPWLLLSSLRRAVPAKPWLQENHWQGCTWP